MHQEKQGSREGFRRGKLAAAAAVVLPAVGIVALTGCLQQLCGSWLDGLSQQALTFDTTLETETDASDAIVTTAADEDAVVTFADADLTENTGVTAVAVKSTKNATFYGCGLYIDGKFYGAYSSASTLRTILDSFKSAYATGEAGETVSFTRDIQLVGGTYPTSDLLTYSAIKSVLESTVEAKKTYTVLTGDTLQSIADRYGMTLSDFENRNAELDKSSLTVGETVNVTVTEPLVQVACTRTETATVSVPFETEVVEDASASGKAEVITEGKNGSKTVTATITTVNGKETAREVLSEKILVEPVTRQVTAPLLTGTSYSASYYGDTGSGVLSEGMIWPLPNNGGTETCYFGEDGHKGVDLAIAEGTDIYAAASGKVVVAGVYYTYGNCVVIDHGNGVRTLYAHCSSLNVSVGDEVSQGDVVGFVGMTGYANGNHLHFEVHINNRSYDPYNFIAR